LASKAVVVPLLPNSADGFGKIEGNPLDDCSGCAAGCCWAGAMAAGGRGADLDLVCGAGTGSGTPCAAAMLTPKARLDSNAATTAARLPMLSSD
jgi:hypothetical protein